MDQTHPPHTRRGGKQAPPAGTVDSGTHGVTDGADDRFDDEDYPAYSMGSAAEMLGVTPTFLRALGAAKLIEPKRSSGGHRRYSRYQLRLAARARELVDQGTPVEAACRIIILEDQLAEALRINAEYERERSAGN
ncbi:MerR family transcriptional regulator [Nonomuraea sp. MTCD27]|uniref:helix-turn-helix domain-containing protein n=1 Tax=Nonomuraea sp. MTCD27 TaxID=1676747 RepID=UPI0035BF75F7